MKVAFVGLGVMGFPMAGHLAKAGHDVGVFNRSSAKAERWVGQHGGATAPSLAAAVAGCEMVALCVGNDDDVRQCVGDILPAMALGGVVVDHTTTSAKIAIEMAAAAREADRWFVDAPVSGGQAGAEAGSLTVMAGGEVEAVDRIAPVIGAYSKAVRRIGGPGAGQKAKMVNQICIAGLVQGLAEGLHFAKCAGLDTEKLIATISKGAAQSWQMENRYKTMVDGKFEFGFAVDWMRKDLGICFAEARRNGATLPVTAVVDQFYAEVQRMGGRRWDTSSLIARLER